VAPPVYSVRFIAVHDQPALLKAEYVVPDGYTAVVRDFDAYYGGSLSAEQVFLVGSADQIVWQVSWAINEAGWRGFRGRQVYYTGETIAVYGTDVMDLTASGYLLLSP